MLTFIASILFLGWSDEILLSLIPAGTTLLFFVGYSLWFWIAKPKKIVVNNWLDTSNTICSIYLLAIIALHAQSEWWYIGGLIAMISILFIALITDKDQTIEL